MDTVCNVDIAEILASKKNEHTDKRTKKKRGQYFTSSSVAKLMANLVDFKKGHMKVLDPGCGTGILIAALVDRILNEGLSTHLSVDLYENDLELIPYLNECMEYCKRNLNRNGLPFTFRIICDDFILQNKFLFEDNIDFSRRSNYDLVISNPPYYKLKKDHDYSKILSQYIHGQPNIYYMFMAVSERLTRRNGQVIFITPRSYCSGLYFEKFRGMFFAKIDPIHFHLFKSRNKIFVEEKVLQENIIFSGIKRKQTRGFIRISSSLDPEIKEFEPSLMVSKSLVFGHSHKKTGPLRLPTNKDDLGVLKLFDQWKTSLSEMGMKISTGPVVTFRNKSHIKKYKPGETYPLFYMRHLKNLQLIFPGSNGEEEGILPEKAPKSLLLEASNYVLLKRFSTNEQKKRINCVGFIGKNHHYKMIALENHLNYIYRPNGCLTEEETIGLVGFLNSNLLDWYFRLVNGNTQVNASDFISLSFPDYSFIVKLGKGILSGKIKYDEVDDIIKSTYLSKTVIQNYKVHEEESNYVTSGRN